MNHKFILLLLVIMLMAGFDLTATAQSLKVGMTSKTLFYLPFYVGLKKGFYNAENLKVEMIFIGRSDVHGATSILVDYLKSKGLQYPRDYAFTVISGGTTARLSALETGAIAAGILGIPYSDIAIDQGFNRLGDTMEVISTYQFNGITVNPSWAEKNRATVVKFLKAHIRSLRWIHEQPDQATELFTSEMGVKQPYARRGIDYFTKNKVFPIDGAVTLDGLKVNIEVQFRDGVLKEPLPSPEKYADQSYVRQAQKELGL